MPTHTLTNTHKWVCNEYTQVYFKCPPLKQKSKHLRCVCTICECKLWLKRGKHLTRVREGSSRSIWYYSIAILLAAGWRKRNFPLEWFDFYESEFAFQELWYITKSSECVLPVKVSLTLPAGYLYKQRKFKITLDCLVIPWIPRQFNLLNLSLLQLKFALN